jgi:hypothetical protein
LAGKELEGWRIGLKITCPAILQLPNLHLSILFFDKSLRLSILVFVAAGL